MATTDQRKKIQLRGMGFKQKEPLTVRIKGILTDYPKGSQILREILQNADDAGSTEQVFLLDHKTYSTTDLINFTLAEYQGPSLIAKSNSTFTDRDFSSLEKLGDSLKKEDLDKTGRYGVGFNAVYHMTDLPMILSGDQFVILDPHERVDFGKNLGGERYNFLEDEFQKGFPTSQFEPFKVLVEDFEHTFEGTIFRYPLRTKKHAESSEISKSPCPVGDVLEMFEDFQVEAAECLLFLKYLEKVSFYELLDGADKPKLLYEIELLNAEEVRQQRQLLARNVRSIMASIDDSDEEILQSVVKEIRRSLSSSYTAEVSCFSHKSNDHKKFRWLVQNHLGDVSKAEKYFFETHKIHLKDNKLIPWVGVAACLSDVEQRDGSLFCFLRLPVTTPFNVFIHGFFAMSSSRRELPTPSQDRLAHDAQMAIKAEWNQYLFHHCIPRAWADLLKALTECGNSDGKPTLPIEDYTFWPSRKDSNSNSKNVDKLWASILDDVVKTIGSDMTSVFRGMTSGSDICNSWISLADGILEDEDSSSLTPLLARCGLSMIPKLPLDIQTALKSNKISYKRASPHLVREHLRGTAGQWPMILSNDDKNKLLKYVLKDEGYQNLRGLPLILLADANGTYASFGETAQPPIYVASEEEHFLFQKWEPRLMSRSIAPLFETHDFESMAKIINIRRWSLQAGIDCLKKVFSTIKNKSAEEIPRSDFNGYGIDLDWLKRLWAWIDSQPKNSLGLLGELWLIPTNQQSLRKVQYTKPILWHNPSNTVHPPATIVPLLEKLGCTFILGRFLVGESTSSRLREVVVECTNAEAVLQGISTNIPGTLAKDETRLLIGYFAKYIRLLPSGLSSSSLDSLKRLPIFPMRVNEELSITAISSSSITWHAFECIKIGGIVLCAPDTGIIDVETDDVKYLAYEVAGLKYLETTEYLSIHVLPLLKSQPPSVVDTLIGCVLEHLHGLLEKNKNGVLQHLCDLPFVKVGTISGASNGKILPPVEIIDKSSDLKDFFLSSEEVFPIGKYAAMSQLHTLGMNKTLNCKIVIDRVTYYADNWSPKTKQEQQDIYKAAMGFLQTLDRCYLKVKATTKNTNDAREMDRALSSKQWIPTTRVDGGVILSTADGSRDTDDKHLVSKVMPTLDYSVKSDLRRVLGWDKDPPIDTVVDQLWALLRQYESNTTTTRDDIPRNLARVFEHLNKIAKSNDMSINHLRTILQNKEWIPVDGKLYSPSKVTLSTPPRLDLKPYLMTIPNSIGKYGTLFECFGVPSALNTPQLIKILQDVKNVVKENKLTESDLELVLQLIKVITEGSDDIKAHGKLFVPSDANILKDVSLLTFDDISKAWQSSSSSSDHFLWCHKKVSRFTGEKLGIQFLSQRLMYGADSETEIWEQEEELTTRIYNLLRDYLDDALFREFLQNADDAKAKKFCIVFEPNPPPFKDSQTLISQEMGSWQGPALWLYNDAEFSEDDFKGLRQVGIGGKKEVDGIRIGKFGLGFLDCYHYTDLPSVVSGSQAVFFDPHRKYLPPRNGIKPAGLRTKFVNGNFEDQFRPYTRLFGFDMAEPFKGTLFRLPLRTKELHSKLSQKSYSGSEIRRMLKEFQDEAFRGALLFLKHVVEIEVSELGIDGNMTQLWRVAAEKLTDDVRHKRMEVEKNKEYTASFCMNLRLSVNGKDETEKWLVSTNLSKRNMDDADLQRLVQFNGLVAHVGVAGVLKTSRQTSSTPLKSLFSFLPLPIMIQFPVHIHGCFALRSDRQALLSQLNSAIDDTKGDHGRSQSYQLSRWNQYLLRERLPKIHLQFLQDLIREGLVESNDNSLDDSTLAQRYFNYWPKEVKEDMLLDYYKNFYSLAMKSGNIFYTQSNGGQWISYQEAVFEDETLISDGIKEGASKIISDFLIERSINIVQLPRSILKSFPEQERKLQQVTPELVRDNIRHTTKAFVQKINPLVFIAFFEYLLSDKAFSELRGCTILPLMDKSFGTLRKGQIQFYIANEEAEIALFPNLSSSFVDLGRLSKPIIEALTTEEVTKELNVKRLDNDVFIQLVSEMLRPGDHLDYDRNGVIINDKWLRDLWHYLDTTESIDMAAFENTPILPTVGLNGVLVSLNQNLPLLYQDGSRSNINAILTKIGTHLIDKQYSKRLSDFVLEFSATNILKCIQLASTKAKHSVDELLLPLSPDERNTLRNFLQGNEYDLFQNESSSKSIEILRQLPIFPAYTSSPTVAFKPAMDCRLLPQDFSVFSVQYGMAILCKNDTEHKFAAKINIPELSVQEYLKDNVLPLLDNPLPVDKVNEYQTFLCKVLSYVEGSQHSQQSQQLCQMLTQHQLIPNDELPNCRLFKASELYDDTHPMFALVFAGAGKFVASGVKTNLSALRKIGLKTETNGSTFIECVDEVVRLSELRSDRPPNYLDRARIVANNFALNFGSNFTLDHSQLSQLVKQKFIPVNTRTSEALPNFAREFLPEIGLLTSLSELCLEEHRNVVWTQCPTLNNLSNHALQQIPNLGSPPVDVVIAHLHCLALTVSPKCHGNETEFRRWLKDTYQFLLGRCNDPESEAKMSDSFSCTTTLFLNGDDPTKSENWKPASHLVIGAEFDINPEMLKIHNFLHPFEKLLVLGDAKKIEPHSVVPISDPDPDDLSYAELVLRSFAEFYRRDDTVANGYKDVVFLVGGHRLPASRILLTMASVYFKTMFLPTEHDGMTETRHENLPIEIEVPDVSSTAFRIMLGFLHTGELDVTPEDIDADNGYAENDPRRQLQAYLDLLQPADMYALDRLKNLIETRIINGKMIGVDTVLDIERYADLYDAKNLLSICQEYRQKNQELIVMAHGSAAINLDEEQIDILQKR